ncbi:Uncharacterized N-acetyltransferase YjcF [Streptococcus pneumoniae]|nr:Uncharacterized N-acetyltransferase YjcF [Streptococcus pneumoniae]
MRIKRITTEIDLQAALEEQCGHVLVYHENQPAGTGRIRIVNQTGKLERICILKPYRKYGLGKVIISE